MILTLLIAILFIGTPQDVQAEKKLGLFLITARIEKIEGNNIILSKGVKDGFHQEMILTINSINSRMWKSQRKDLERAKIALAKVISADDKKAVAQITWHSQRTYKVWPWESPTKKSEIKQVSVNPEDLAVGTYYDTVSDEDTSRANIILSLYKFPEEGEKQESQPRAFVNLIGDKTLIETEDKSLETKLAMRFGTPLKTRMEDPPLLLPNTERYFEVMRSSAALGLFYEVIVKKKTDSASPSPQPSPK